MYSTRLPCLAENGTRVSFQRCTLVYRPAERPACHGRMSWAGGPGCYMSAARMARLACHGGGGRGVPALMIMGARPHTARFIRTRTLYIGALSAERPACHRVVTCRRPGRAGRVVTCPARMSSGSASRSRGVPALMSWGARPGIHTCRYSCIMYIYGVFCTLPDTPLPRPARLPLRPLLDT